MRFLRSYKQFENIGPNIELGLNISYQELIDASNLVELDFDSLFKTYKSTLEELVSSSDFLTELSSRDLVSSEIFDTTEVANLLEEDIKYIFLYATNDAEKNIDPVYILIQSGNDKIKLYYTSEDLNRFHEKISSRVIKITDLSNNKQYIYTTSNAGVNWSLQNVNEKTEKFKKNLYGETLMQWLNDNKIQVVVTN